MERIVSPWREHLPGRLVRSDTSTSPLLVCKITSGEKHRARRTKAHVDCGHVFLQNDEEEKWRRG